MKRTEILDFINSEFHSEPVTAKELATDQDVRWCPGCGDYSILKQVQTVIPSLNIPREKIVFVSGIGCSSRFPYYLNTYGIHSIHGRAPAIATGLKTARPDLNVWIVTGDGDALSIGGNHFIHLLRRNVDVKVLLFNNEIYGLTKGQYSPTSLQGQITKSTPMGAIDHPFNPIALSLGADASFVARTMDRDPKHQQSVLMKAAEHTGTALVEIYQNCNVYNDGAFFIYTDKETKPLETIFVEHGQPLVFGENHDKGIALKDGKPIIINMNEESFSINDLWVHDEHDAYKAFVLSRMFDDPSVENHFPRPFGVFYSHARPTYNDQVHEQLAHAKTMFGEGDLDALIRGNQTWTVA